MEFLLIVRHPEFFFLNQSHCLFLPLLRPPRPPPPKSPPTCPPHPPLSSPPPPPVSQCPPDVLSLLARYPAVTCASLTTWPTPRHHTTHSIHTACPPIAARARRLSPEQLSVAEKTFKELESLGIVRRSDSPWSSPAPYGTQTKWQLAAMRRLSPFKCSHNSR